MRTYIVLTAFLVSFLVGCSPERRISNILRKHPHLKSLDTVAVNDSFFIPKVEHDTVISIHTIRGRDTVIIHKDRLTQKIFYHDSLIYLSARCDADTVVKTIKVPVEPIRIETVKPFPWWFWLLCGFGVLALLNQLIQLRK